MYCRNCGQPVEENSTFCKHCGAALAGGAPGTRPEGLSAAFPQATHPGLQPQPVPPSSPRRTGLIIGIIAGVLVLLAGIGVGVYFLVRDRSGETTASATTSTEGTNLEGTDDGNEPFNQAEGEIFLEPAGVPGPESFAGELFVVKGSTTTLSIPGTTLPLPPTTKTGTSAAIQVASVSGDTPALYGGSKNKLIADKEGQLRFFEQNPDKAEAFCAALNADPTFRWSGGNKIKPSQLRAYFDELTPLLLTQDTRVTNHGYRNGKPVPRQSVLQKGQLVLVDRYGVPRVRCECGNPLTPPKPVQKTPKYTGPRWPDFDPTRIIVVQPAPVIINIFVVIDVTTGEIFDRPVGTQGTQDTPRVPEAWQVEVELGWDDLENQHTFTVTWSGALEVGPDGVTLVGDGEGRWHVEGAYFEGSTVVGQMQADGSLGVELSGQLDLTESGYVLSIVPVLVGFSIDSQEWEGSDHADAQADFESAIEYLIASSFGTLDFGPTSGGPVYAQVQVEGWTGSATLTQLGSLR